MTIQVVLCDDERHILHAAEFKLQRAGMEVRCADDGEEAWALIQQARPDVLVTDYQMPNLDGLCLIRRLRESNDLHDLPVIMLTAKGFELSGDQLRAELGVSVLLSKPFSPRELLKQVQQLAEQTPAAKAN